MCITVCRFYFEYTVSKFKDGNIECTTTKVIYSNCLFLVLILFKTESKSCCCRFVDDTLYIKTCNFTSVFCSLTLRVVKVSRNCNYSFCNWFSKVVFCSFLHLLKYECRNFLRRILFLFAILFNFYAAVSTVIKYCIWKLCCFTLKFTESVSDKTFCRIYSVLWISYHLVFCRLTYNTVSLSCKTNDRRSCTSTF